MISTKICDIIRNAIKKDYLFFLLHVSIAQKSPCNEKTLKIPVLRC